jgi:hypothetical protein
MPNATDDKDPQLQAIPSKTGGFLPDNLHEGGDPFPMLN